MKLTLDIWSSPEREANVIDLLSKDAKPLDLVVLVYSVHNYETLDALEDFKQMVTT